MKARMTIFGALILGLLVLPVLAQEGEGKPDEPEEPGKAEKEKKEDRGPSIRLLKNDLLKAVNTGDPKQIEEALFQFRHKGGRHSVKALVGFMDNIPESMGTVYWQVVRGIAAFTDDEAMTELGNQILANKSNHKSRDLMYGLSSNRDVRITKVHAIILSKGSADLQQMAIDQLTDIRAVESVDVLIEALRAGTLKEKVLWWTERALEILTKANLGRDGERWHEWWQHNRKKGLPPAEREDTTGMVTDNLDPVRKYEFKALKKMPMGQVIVVKTACNKGNCDFDSIQDILARMEIPHTVVKREDFAKTSLDDAMAIIINCTQIKPHCICPTCKPGGNKQDRLYRCTGCDEHETISHALDAKSVKMIKNFVARGGFLFTEDWGLKEVLEKAWPKILQSGKYLKEQSVDVAPARGMTSHRLMRGVFVDPMDLPPVEPDDGDDDDGEGGFDEEEKRTKDGKKTIDAEDEEEIIARIRNLNHEWKIDDESPYMKIRAKGQVQVLLESEKVGKQSEGNRGVAVTFMLQGKPTYGSAGKGEARSSGRVVHVMSHFGKQNSQEDEFALQNLLLNFLLEANKLFHEGKKK